MADVDFSRWIGWRRLVTWSIGAVAYHVWMHLPFPIARRCGWMLPYVGDYAHWDDAIAAMREGT